MRSDCGLCFFRIGNVPPTSHLTFRLSPATDMQQMSLMRMPSSKITRWTTQPQPVSPNRPITRGSPSRSTPSVLKTTLLSPPQGPSNRISPSRHPPLLWFLTTRFLQCITTLQCPLPPCRPQITILPQDPLISPTSPRRTLSTMRARVTTLDPWTCVSLGPSLSLIERHLPA